VWVVLESQWEEKFDALKEYKKSHGHCNVPSTWPKNKPLAIWVGHQRQCYRNNKLSKARIKRLEDIGFVWKLSKR
jgi:hypothetical protein